ncbi:hypothetical protein BCEP4_2750003 [Burkholderia cepacia]|nr:hypothetical protein BCEP4_2750003 [Burkholderia cepacia]
MSARRWSASIPSDVGEFAVSAGSRLSESLCPQLLSWTRPVIRVLHKDIMALVTERSQTVLVSCLQSKSRTVDRRPRLMDEKFLASECPRFNPLTNPVLDKRGNGECSRLRCCI